MTASDRPRLPGGLGLRGAALWRKLTAELEFSASELVTLELACRQADDLANLEAFLAAEGLAVTGSKGQKKLSGVPAEIRQQRASLNRLVAALAAPDVGDDVGLTPAQKRAQKAAQSRWLRQNGRSGRGA